MRHKRYYVKYYFNNFIISKFYSKKIRIGNIQKYSTGKCSLE
jgi:hypothetical protein